MKVFTQGSKTILAKLLAGENMIVQHKNIEQSSFDPKTRVITLPIYDDKIDEDVYDILVSHEVAHALFTPRDKDAENAKTALHHYYNVVEDHRVEKMIKTKFPGLARPYYNGYKKLFDDGYFGVDEKELSELLLGDRFNVSAKVSGLDIPFTEEEQKIVDAAKNAVTFEEMKRAAYDMYVYDRMQENDMQSQGCDSDDEEDKEENDEKEKSEGGKGKSDEKDKGEKEEKGEGKGEGEDDEENGEGEGKEDDKEGGNKKGEGEEGDGEEDGEGEGEGEDTDENSPKNDSKSNKSNKGNTNSNKPRNGNKKSEEEIEEVEFKEDDIEPQLKSQATVDAKLKGLVQRHTVPPMYLTYPDLKTSDFIVPALKVLSDFNATINSQLSHTVSTFETSLKEFVTSNKRIVAYLHKEFLLKMNAEQQKRSLTHTSGELDVSKVFKYRYDEDIFKKVTTVPNGKSHGLILYLDWSGSMNDKFTETVMQLIVLILFCKRAGIPFDLYAFTDNYRSQTVNHKYKNTDIKLPRVKLLNLISSSLSTMKYNKALLNLWILAHNISCTSSDYRLSDTPLDSSLFLVPKIIEEFKKKYKVQIAHLVVLTDGMSNDGFYTASNDDQIKFNTNNIVTVTHDYKTYSIWNGTSDKMSPSVKRTCNIIEMVKDISKANIVGFSLIHNTRSSLTGNLDYYGVQANTKELERFEKDGCFTIKKGYDELYFTSFKNMNIRSNGNFFQKASSTEAAEVTVRRAFQQMGAERLKSRVVLSRFISLISSPKENY